MYLRELHNSLIDTAVIFHNNLNPKIWGPDHLMQRQVRFKLLEIAKHLVDFIEVPHIYLKDITISGSNAAYTYTENSDIDLHLVVDVPGDGEQYYKELFKAKKNQYNFDHNITIRNIDVEVYVQDAKEAHHSSGIYSILDNRWISTPKAVKVNINDKDVLDKVDNYLSKIEFALKSNDLDVVSQVKKRLHSLRKTGLEREGEFSAENISYKILRNKGYIKKLQDHIYHLEDRQLSLETFYGVKF